MVTVSHHTRACPRDISGLLISAFPGSHCVVTVTTWPHFFGRGAGERHRRFHPQKTRSRSCLYPFSPTHQADLQPKGLQQPARWLHLDCRPNLGSTLEATQPSLGQAEVMCPCKGLGRVSLISAAFSKPAPASFLHQVSFQLDQLPMGAKPALCIPHSCLLCYAR